MISVIIPTYNEAENIPRLIPQISKHLRSEIIVVDDNSPDGTADVVRRLSALYPVKLIVRQKKAGLASAVLDGARQAKGEIIGVMDADLSHPAELLPTMAEQAKRADIVIASRYVSGGAITGWPVYRRAVSKVATLLARTVLRIKITDPMSGFFFVKRDLLLRTPIRTSGYKLLLNILVANRGAKVVEIPYTFRERTAGQSKMDRKEIVNYLITLARLLHL